MSVDRRNLPVMPNHEALEASMPDDPLAQNAAQAQETWSQGTPPDADPQRRLIHDAAVSVLPSSVEHVERDPESGAVTALVLRHPYLGGRGGDAA